MTRRGGARARGGDPGAGGPTAAQRPRTAIDLERLPRLGRVLDNWLMDLRAGPNHYFDASERAVELVYEFLTGMRRDCALVEADRAAQVNAEAARAVALMGTRSDRRWRPGSRGRGTEEPPARSRTPRQRAS